MVGSSSTGPLGAVGWTPPDVRPNHNAAPLARRAEWKESSAQASSKTTKAPRPRRDRRATTASTAAAAAVLAVVALRSRRGRGALVVLLLACALLSFHSARLASGAALWFGRTSGGVQPTAPNGPVELEPTN